MSDEPTVVAVQADITTLHVDAIVNAANERLLGGGGVDGAIHRAAGRQLYDACKSIPEVRRGVRCPTGEARITPGFNLPAKFVIHTVGPVWDGGGCGEDELLANCYRNSLKLAAENHLTSVAFPAISTGIYGYPLDRATTIAVREARTFLASHQSMHITFCCFGNDALQTYRAALKSVQILLRMGELRIGISGWTYPPWRGVFYPPDLPQKRELHFASRQLNSIEINGSFYSLQRPASYRSWYEQTPDDFVFSLKGGRFLTHIRRLRDVRIPLANFLASGVLQLKEKLGPLFWQFPPNFKFDVERFETFFKLLPRTTKAASRLAEEHEIKGKDRADPTTGADRPMRHAVEVRHESFHTPEFTELCRAHDVAIVTADSAGKWPYFEDQTAADFSYLRLHGAEELYVSGYTDEALDEWAMRIRKWSPKKRPRDVFVYFDNDVKVRSPLDAMRLAKRLGLRVGTMDPTLAGR